MCNGQTVDPPGGAWLYERGCTSDLPGCACGTVDILCAHVHLQQTAGVLLGA